MRNFGLDEQSRQAMLRWKQMTDYPFERRHQEARSRLKRLFRQRESERPNSAAEFVLQLCGDDNYLRNMVAPDLGRQFKRAFSTDDIRQLYSAYPHWKLYFAAFAYDVFARAIQTQGHGRWSNAGQVDLGCAVYLPFCDWFITDDKRQRQALQLLNDFNPRQTEVLSYEQLKRRLAIG